MWCLTLITEEGFHLEPAQDAPLLPLSDYWAKMLQLVWSKHQVVTPENVIQLLDHNLAVQGDGILFISQIQGLCEEAKSRHLLMGWTNLLQPNPHLWGPDSE